MLHQVFLRLRSTYWQFKPVQVVPGPCVVVGDKILLATEVRIAQLSRRSNPPVKIELVLRSTEPLLELTRDDETLLIADRSDGLGGLMRCFDRLQGRWSSPESLDDEPEEVAAVSPPPVVEGMWAAERWVDKSGRTSRWVSIHVPRFEGPDICIVGTTVADGVGAPRTNFTRGPEALSALVDRLDWLGDDWPSLVDDLAIEILVHPTIEWMGAWSRGASPRLAEIGPLEPMPSGLWRIFAAVDGVELSFVERSPILALIAASRYLSSLRYRVGNVGW